MPTIQSITLTRSLDLDVEYLIEPAEKDIGHPRSVEIVSVSIEGRHLPLPASVMDGLYHEILEIEGD